MECLAVTKRSGAVRICVDLKPLDQSVLSEPHPILKVDEVLAQLTGARVFSKLDVNSGNTSDNGVTALHHVHNSIRERLL